MRHGRCPVSELKRTERRHQILRLVAAGEMQMYQHPGSVWDGFIRDGSQLTNAGRDLLAAWNDQYGEVQP